MSKIALSIGCYSFSIFVVGVLGILNPPVVGAISIVFILTVLVFSRDIIFSRELTDKLKFSSIERVVLLLIVALFSINLLGALGPEISFDALWYHLTIPKIYIQNALVNYIPGNLFYYSAMPKLGDLLYIPALMFGNEIVAKLIHLMFGVLCCFAVFRLALNFVDRSRALLGVLIFYSNIVVAWESTVAYVDLIWSFFVIMSVVKLFDYFKNNMLTNLILSSVFLGFAIGVKILSLRDMILMTLILCYFLITKRQSIYERLLSLFSFIFPVSILVIPHLIFAFYYTGNPIYPFFSDIYSLSNPRLLSIENFLNELRILFFMAPDPISPIYVIFLPLVIYYFRPLSAEKKLLSLFVLASIPLWYFTYQSGAEGRYAIPYLGVFSVMCVVVLVKTERPILKLLTIVIILVAITTISYRLAASFKYIPVVFGVESKQNFLKNNLNFAFGDFYDTDGYFSKTIKPQDKVLTYGIHNLYYIDFDFIDSTYRKSDDKFNYVLIRGELPVEFGSWTKVYENQLSNVKLYVK